MLVGAAIVYESLSEPLAGGAFRERIARAGVERWLDRTSDCLALVNHDLGQPIGRLAAGTLRLRSSPSALRVEIDEPQTSYAQDLLEVIRRRDVAGMSFAFTPMMESWTTDRLSGMALR